MKIYLAATGPGNESWRERGMLDISTRLLSYYLIINKTMESHQVFEKIKHENLPSGTRAKRLGSC